MKKLKLIPITNKGKQRSGTKNEVEVNVIRSLDKCPCFNSSPGLFVEFPNGHQRWIRLDGSPEFKLNH